MKGFFGVLDGRCYTASGLAGKLQWFRCTVLASTETAPSYLNGA